MGGGIWVIFQYPHEYIWSQPQKVEGGGDGGGLFFDLIERKKALSA